MRYRDAQKLRNEDEVIVRLPKGARFSARVLYIQHRADLKIVFVTAVSADGTAHRDIPHGCIV